MTIASFFSGCGGLDTGFKKAGFDIVWANEVDANIAKTYKLNHPTTQLSIQSIKNLRDEDIPNCDGFIGGPPCQPWSVGGLGLGLKDKRGELFLDYINLIGRMKPKFFVIETVSGILEAEHKCSFDSFLSILKEAGYDVYYKLLNAKDYLVPQDRKRVFIVGFLNQFNIKFSFPSPVLRYVSLHDAISDILQIPIFTDGVVDQNESTVLKNHHVYVGPFDSRYMARNRVRAWSELSYTILAQAKNCPLHPQAPKMQFVSSDKRVFVSGSEHLYRRFSVRECARIQTFPDSYVFKYDDVRDGYKMVGNAVPPNLAFALASSIYTAISETDKTTFIDVLVGYYKNEFHKKMIYKNKLYYVRAGNRFGAMNFDSLSHVPKFLLLYNNTDKVLLKIVDPPLFLYLFFICEI